ncbi:MAG: hypothetical protein JNK79_08515, partial [Chitinophagaceae bacterium]|nr:hypothetical protein [Chitinophagaceae bacterium]
MKLLYLSLLLLLSCTAFSQNKQWTWINGTAQLNKPAVYGTKGVADASSTPGARDGAESWTTPDGKLWLFGGLAVNSNGNHTYMNDLWMFDPSTNLWTWKHGPTTADPQTSNQGTQGVPSSTNLPMNRQYASTWTDKAGNLWMYGGRAQNRIGNLADLWKYDPAINQWTWISGTTNAFDEGEYGAEGVPDAGSRPPNLSSASAAVDINGNFWMVGGFTLQLFTDDVEFTTRTIWRYDPVAQLWTYFGDNDLVAEAISHFPNFGTKGVADPANLPPTRLAGGLWVDSSGHLYWFGGLEFYFVGAGSDDLRFETATRNDLWRYDTSTRIWTWINGNKEREAFGRYGTKGSPDPLNTPGARLSFATFDMLDGKMMLFGGSGYSEDNSGSLNDLWSYDPSNNEWTWLSGSKSSNEGAVYGTKGTPDSLNHPGAASELNSFTQHSENAIWIYGGGGFAANASSTSESGLLGDLWRYAIAQPAEDSVQVFESFSAKEKRGYVELKWKIAKDQATDHIIVEHSRNGNEFEKLGRVQPPRRGNSRSYSYVHVLPGKGDHYYRLKHVSKSNKTDYSWVERVTVGNPHTLPHNLDISFLLYPNPF